MINIAQDSIFNLHPINLSSIRKDITQILIAGEEPVAAFRTVRDQMVFTNKRIIAIDIIGMTGVKKQYFSLPYSKIVTYSFETPGLVEFVPDSVLTLTFQDGFKTKFEFKGNTDILALNRAISEYIL